MKTIFNDIRHLPEFKKDLKKLLKRYRSLEDDLKTFTKTALKLKHKQNTETTAIVQISDLGITTPQIYKARKFACKALKGSGSRSGIRVIYAYHEKEDVVEFIEIYYKGDKENEDRERIMRYYEKI